MALTTVKSDQIQSSVALAGSPTTTTQSASDNSTKVATTAYVETAVANLVASAPSALNTLDELAAALNDDASFSTTVTNSIATKLPLAGGTMSGALNMGSQNITNAGTIAGTLATAAQTNITSVGTLTGLTSSGSIQTTGSATRFISNSSSSGDYIRIYAGSGTGKWDIYGNGANLRFSDNDGAGAVYIDTSVGIGTAPAVKFDVMTAGANQWYIRNSDNSAQNNAIVSLRTGGYSNIALDGATVDLKIGGYSKLHVDASGQVGIGINAPSYQLEVRTGNNWGVVHSDGTRKVATYIDASGGNDGLYTINSMPLALGVGGAAKFWIDTSGNVGIGTASPSSYYSSFDNLVIGTTGANGITIVSSTNQVGTVAFADGTSGLDLYRGFVQYNHTSDELYIGTDGATKLTIDDDGNVGIGTATPSELFHVQHQTSNAKILVETDSSTSIPEIQFKSANNEIHRIGVETATGNQGYGGSTAYSLNIFARSGREIHFGSGVTQHMLINANGRVGVNVDPYAQFGVYRNHTDPYTVGSFLDYPTMELKHPSTTGSYNGTRYTNTAGNYEWFAGTNQTASNAADFVFQGYDRGNTTYKEMARIHDSGSMTVPNQVGFRARGSRAAWVNGTTTSWNILTSANTGNASGGVFPIGLTTGGETHMNGYNVGNCFNVSNGRFTAPIEGKYQVYGSVYCNKTGTTSGGYMHLLVYINGQQINEIYTIGGEGHSFAHSFSLNFSTILYLEVNDYVNWQVYSDDASVRIYAGHCSLGAHLLS